MGDLGFSRLKPSVVPASQAAFLCLPAYRREALWLMTLSIFAVGLEAAGIGLIYMLIKPLMLSHS